MFEKLESLGLKTTFTGNVEKIKLLQELETMVGSLPGECRGLLLYSGSNINFLSIISFKGIESSPWADENGYDSIEYFYGLDNKSCGYNIFEVMDTYKNDLNKTLIPIGASSGGNQICICIESEGKGSIWFWDHETDPIFYKGKAVSGLSLISLNLKDFIDRLVIDNDSSPSKALGGFLDF